MPTTEAVTKWVDKYMPDEKDRQCHVCDVCLSKEETIKRVVDGEAKVQTFTGRLFCSDECWDSYLVSEGLKESDDEE